MNNEKAKQYIMNLYKAVDNKDLYYLKEHMADDVNFRIGNFETFTDNNTALAANEQFFSSINSMSHTLENVWVVENTIISNGTVDYIRLDGSEHAAYFSTVLNVVDNKIADYFVYADISAL
jgi:ketosteroid isomerase-like protein